MSHLIGRGRYAREVYPTPRQGGGTGGLIQRVDVELTLAEIRAAGAVLSMTKLGPAFPANAYLLGGYMENLVAVSDGAGVTCTFSLMGINGLGSDWLIGSPGPPFWDPTGTPPSLAGGFVAASVPSGFAMSPVGGRLPQFSFTLSANLDTMIAGDIVGHYFYTVIVP